MTEHVSPSEVDAFLRGGLPPDRVLVVGRHLSQCADCARTAAPASAQRRVVEQLLQDDDLHLDADGELFPFLDGTLDAITRERVDEHLASCSSCREELADLRRTTAVAAPRPRRVWMYAAAAAAAILIAILVLPLVRDRGPAPHDVVVRTHADAQERAWRATVDRAVHAGIALPAELHELAPRRGTLRGGEDVAAPQLSPMGTVIEETRPAFAWSAMPNARYRVVIFEGTREVVSSATLDVTRWQPAIDLARGATYVWQLHVITPGARTILPPPSGGPAAVRILDAERFAALQDARRRRPTDHLLLGVLYAQAGVVDTAETELELAAKTDARAAALLETVRGWRSVVQADEHV